MPLRDREKRQAYEQAYRAQHREKAKLTTAKWRAANPGRNDAAAKRWRESNPERDNARGAGTGLEGPKQTPEFCGFAVFETVNRTSQNAYGFAFPVNRWRRKNG